MREEDDERALPRSVIFYSRYLITRCPFGVPPLSGPSRLPLVLSLIAPETQLESRR